MWSDEGSSTMITEGYCVIKNFFTLEQLNKFADDLDSSRKRRYQECNVRDTEDNKFAFNDGMILKSYSEAFPQFTISILMDNQKRIEEHIGLTLFPVCAYARIYYKHSSMYKHTDREACEISITFPVKHDKEPWAIWLEDGNGKNVEIKLELGDILVYKGRDLVHWRLPYMGEEHYQLMLHYVDANGSVSHRKYDNHEERFNRG